MMADVRRVKTSGRSSLKRVFVLAAVFLCFAKLQQKMVVDSELPGFLVLFSQARVARDGRGRTRVISSPHLLVNCRSSSSATIFLLLAGDIESNPGPADSSLMAVQNPGPADRPCVTKQQQCFLQLYSFHYNDIV